MRTLITNINMPIVGTSGIKYCITCCVFKLVACHCALATGGKTEKNVPRIIGTSKNKIPYVIANMITEKPKKTRLEAGRFFKAMIQSRIY